jgi:hypothetical protein
MVMIEGLMLCNFIWDMARDGFLFLNSGLVRVVGFGLVELS